MSFDIAVGTAAAGGQDTLLARAARWIIGKIWFGCVLSGIYYAGQHYGWPEFVQTIIATVGAVALALVSVYLPVWTRTWTTGARPLDLGIKWAVWLGLFVPVGGLLVGSPATGACALALLLVSLGRTFQDRLGPAMRGLRMEHPVRPAPTAPPRRIHPAARPRTTPAHPPAGRRVSAPTPAGTGGPPRTGPARPARRRPTQLPTRPAGWGPN